MRHFRDVSGQQALLDEDECFSRDYHRRMPPKQLPTAAHAILP